MSNKMTGTVKFFNAEKGFGFISRPTAAKTCSFTSPPSRPRASRPWTKVSALSSPSSKARKARLLLT